MKTLMYVCLMAAALQAQDSKQTSSKQAAPSKQSEKSTSQSKDGPKLPANAEPVSEGVWRVKDESGKTWLWRRTPFGYAKVEEGAEGKSTGSAAPGFEVSSVKGDTVEFARQTPFAKVRWTRKISELSGEEKTVYEAQKNSKTDKQ